MGVCAVEDITLVVNAVSIVLKDLERVCDSSEAHRLRAKAAACAKEAEAWRDHPPSVENREALMRRVLGLHTAAAWLGRARSP
jgi:hypothetical protein